MAAANNTQSYREILQSISKRQLNPVYILYGEEGYFIDRLTEAFEGLVPEEERDFNLYSFYAHEITPEVVTATCMKFPMMSDRQVVILKEAQAIKENILSKLAGYVGAPNKSTVLVICFRSDKPKGREFLAKARSGGAVMFESKKLTDANADQLMTQLITEKGLNIEPKGLAMLRDFIGTDVAKMYNEVNKMALILGPGAMITPEAIERNVGISKDFNNFELIDAIATKDVGKIFRIITYFRSNPKNHPTIMTVALVYNYFANLTIAWFIRGERTPSTIMAALGFKWPRQVNSILTGMKNYNAYKCLEIISAIREFDTKNKGIGSRQSDFDLLHDLMFHIVTAPGKIDL